MPDSSEKNLIRFACPSCGAGLAVDPVLAGTEGACTSCGALLTVPPLGVSTTLPEIKAAPVAVQPRLRSRNKKRAVSGSPFELVTEAGGDPHPGPARVAGESKDIKKASPVPKPDRSRKPVTARRSRAVSPATALSQSHEDKKNMKAFITMVIVTCVVACIALGVYYFMVYGQY